jgi:endonuclease G
MKNRFLYSSLILFLTISICSSCRKNQEVDKSNSTFINNSISVNKRENKGRSDLPDNAQGFDFLPSSTTNQVVSHKYYTLSYHEEFEQAEWVAYELKKSFLKNSNFRRPFFIEDSKVITGSASWRNYKRSGFDKGHLCPAGDMEFSEEAYNDTFLTSNIAPQTHDFNNGVWNRLEQKVRYWADIYDGIYVVTGGVLNKDSQTIGKENVLVPKFFYKILLDYNKGDFKMIAFLIPNQKSNKPLYSFVVSVDLVEKMTGIDFFPRLKDNVEHQLEKNSDYKNWSFN